MWPRRRGCQLAAGDAAAGEQDGLQPSYLQPPGGSSIWQPHPPVRSQSRFEFARQDDHQERPLPVALPPHNQLLASFQARSRALRLRLRLQLPLLGPPCIRRPESWALLMLQPPVCKCGSCPQSGRAAEASNGHLLTKAARLAAQHQRLLSSAHVQTPYEAPWQPLDFTAQHGSGLGGKQHAEQPLLGWGGSKWSEPGVKPSEEVPSRSHSSQVCMSL